MKKKQVLALGMAAALTVSMSSGTVSLAAEADIGRQSTVEVTEKGDGENAVTVNDAKSVEENIEVNAENFPDEAFREYVSGRFDKDGDGVLSPEEIEKVISVKIENRHDIQDLTGIQYFTSMTILNCKNSGVTAIDVTGNPELGNLNCAKTQVAKLDVSKNSKLQQLYCFDTQIEALDLSENQKLMILECYDTNLSELDLSKNPALTRIFCQNTGIKTLDLTNQTTVSNLNCSNTNISSLDVSGQANLQNLYCGGTEISELDLSSNPKLILLDVENANLSTLDVSGTKVLTLKCKGNPLYTVSLGERGDLLLSSTFPESTEVDLEVPSSSFDLEEKLPGVDAEKVEIVSGGRLDGTVLSGYEEGTPVIYKYHAYDAEENASSIQLTVTLNLTIVEEGLAINAENFPDATFRAYVEDQFDKDGDQSLSQAELDAVKSVKVIDNTDVKSLKGIEYFTNLTSLHCYNTGITELDVSSNVKLDTLSCYSTDIAQLDITNLTALKFLYCKDTKISSLDVTNCPVLERLVCNNTLISSIDVRNNPKLLRLECDGTAVSSLDLSQNLKLMTLCAQNTKLSTLNLEVNNDLQTIKLEGSPIYAMSIGYKTAKTRLYLSETVLDFEVAGESVDLTTLLPGIDPAKVTIVSGGILEGNMLSGYANGTPVVYTYDFGQVKNQAELRVTLNITFEEKAEAVVFASVNGISAEGESLQAAIESSGITAEDVKGLTIESGNVTKDDLTYIKEECDDLESLVLNLTDGLTYENGSTILPMKAFTGMRYLESVELGGFTEIGMNAFQNSGVVSVDIPDATTINSQAFQGCTALESVHMPSVETIGNNAFYGTDSLTEVTLPASIESLDRCGFGSPEYGTMDGFHLIIEKTTPPELNGSVVGTDGTVSVPAGALSAYLDKTDFDRYFTSTGDISWAGLIVEDPSYSMVTFRGETAGQTAYAYVADGSAVTEKQMPVFTKDGYVLDSWNTEQDGTGTMLKAGDSLDGSMTVYAQWKEEVKDEKAPTAQISTGGTLQNIDQENPYNINISLKFHDETSLDYYVLNDKVSPTKLNGTWGDGNYQNINAWLNEGNGEDGRNTLTVYDKAGNFTTYTFYVDQTKPELAGEFVITPDNNTMSTSKTVTFTTTEPVVVADGWTQAADSDGMKWQKEFTENFKGTVQFADAAGNTSDAYALEVKRIENVKPEAEITYSNNGEPTNEDVAVTVKTNVECRTPDGWEIVPGSSKRNQFQKTYSENTEETVTFTSLSGIEADITISVSGIDKQAPEAEVEYSTTEPTYESVLVTIRTNEPIRTPEGWTKVDDATYTKEYTHNVDRNVNIYDLAGNGNDVDIRITNIVEKAEEKEVIVSYVFEKNGKEVGTEKIKVDADAYNFNTDVLRDIPKGYEIVYIGDTMINKDNTAEVTVRKAKKKAEAKLIIWWIDEWGNKLLDKHGNEMKVEVTAKGAKGEYHTFTKKDWKMPKGYEYATDADKWYAEQDFRIKYGETLDTLSVAIHPVEKNNKDR